VNASIERAPARPAAPDAVAVAAVASETTSVARGLGGGARRIRIVAREEYRRALESRWLFGFAALLAALVVGLSFFGLAQSREVGFQGFARVTLSLMNLVLFVVPLLGLLLGVTSITTAGGTLPLLLAQPVSRSEVYLGKYLGLALALTVAQAVGFGAGGVAIAFHAGADQLRGFVVLAALSFALGWLTVAVSLLIGVLWTDRLKSIPAALGLWLVLVVAYDLVVLGATAALRGVPLQTLLFPALILNPVDLVRVLTTLATGSGALFGPTSAVLVRFFGTGGGIAIGLATLVIETVVPLALGVWLFRRRDW
jgi:Cu-processing system permease protein